MTTQPATQPDPSTAPQPTDPPPPPPPPPPETPDAAQLREQLAQAEARLAQMRRRHTLENALRDAGAIDIEAAATLIETDTHRKDDAAAAIRDLKQRRPYLFGAAAAPSAGTAMSPVVTSTPESALYRAAEDARAGDPNAVLRYMRLRREVH